MARFDSSRAVFFKDGKPLAQGDLLKQTDLAATYRAIAARGSAWFYRGQFAVSVEAWMRQNGGLLTARDFRNYKIRLRQPINTSYRGFQIVAFPPPSSGGVHVVQMLNILENFDLKSLEEATRLHIIAEAMKLAFADRAYWLGDPDFAKVPRGLVSKQYAAALAKKINRNGATEGPSHGRPPGGARDVFAALNRSSRRESALIPQTGSSAPGGEREELAPAFAPQRVPGAEKHTTHWSVADAEGNWVACTATVNTSFGSKVVIPGTGVVMNNQMDDFSTQPGVANYFGLIGAEANAVAPGKRPLSSMSPTIVLKDGKPLLALGAAGGPRIISQVLLELVGVLDLGMTPAEAPAQPRIHHQWFPEELVVEKTLPGPLQAALTERGHKLKVVPWMGVSQIVARGADGRGFVGAADPRVGGRAAGW